jgi:Carboxypeptidase regulatory-like domain/TonB dependent receptor
MYGKSVFGIAMAVLCAAALGPPVAAQETINSASLSGRVSDPSGAPLPGVRVVARQVATNVSDERTTGRDGRFRFASLKVGTYKVDARLDGFSPYSRMVTLTVGSAFDLPIQLAIGSLSETVNVTADPPLVDTARSQIAGTVSQVEAQTLPLNGRNFLDLALFLPGVSPPNVGATQLFAETSAVPGGGLSIGSQRNFSNNFIVDGLSANDDAAGLSGIPFGVDAIDQFQVVTSGGQAELGRALGGYVNVVTKSGTNNISGDAYEYHGEDRFNAPNALSGAKLPMHQNQVGGAVGGPIVRDKAFYFANVERRSLQQSGLTTIAPAAVQAINDRLTASGYGGAGVATGIFPNPVETTNLLAKIDGQAGRSGQLSLRYAQYNAASSNSRGAGGLSAPSASAGLDNVDRSVAVGYTATLSARTVNEMRAQVGRGNLSAPPADSIGPAVSIAGVASFGTLSVSPTARRNTLAEVVDNLSHQAGAHALRAGVDFLYNDDTITFPRAFRGSYTFSSLANFLTGTYNNAGFTETFGASAVSQHNPNLGVFVQDEWKAAPDLTFNAGLRYDVQVLQTIETDTNNVSPRVGVAWSPAGDTATVVRGSAGLYYDRIPLRALANALLSANNSTDVGNLRQVNVVLSPGQAGAPQFPLVLDQPVASVTLPNLTTMSRTMQNAYSRQAGVEIERQIGAHSTVTAGYQYARGVDLIVSLNQNVPSCVAVGTNNGCRPVSAYANNSQYSPAAASAYHALTVSFSRRPSPHGYYRVSYTLSKAMDDVGQFFFSQPIDPFDVTKDWARSDNDQRHRLVLEGAISSPAGPAHSLVDRLTHDFQVSGVLQYYSALPLNITSGLTTVQGTTARPLVGGAFISRNAGVGPDFFAVNGRVTRTFKIGERRRLQAIAEGFNLTNRRNVVAVNGNFGPGAYPSNPSPTFGQATAVADSRTVQLAVRVTF